MTELTQTRPATSSAKGPSRPLNFPRAILSCSREEFDELELTVHVRTLNADGEPIYVNGSLPTDLYGHVFIASPVGSLGSLQVGPTGDTVLPSHDGWTPLLNGDGMVYRFDFHQTPTRHEPGKAWLTTRLVKSPSYHADVLTHGDSHAKTHPKFWSLRFWNLGIARFSLRLGLGEQVNTGLQVFRFEGDAGDRLLVTNDASRAYELDPCTLKTIAPVGLNKYWEPMAKSSTPFQGVMSAAHPCFDFKTKDLYTVNVKKSIKTAFRFPFSLRYDGTKTFWRNLLEVLMELGLEVFELLLKLLSDLGILSQDALYLVHWKDGNEIKKWPVKRPNGSPVVIRQSSHTLGLTENHIVLVDTAFKLAPEDMLPGSIIRPLQRWLEKVEEPQNKGEKIGIGRKIIARQLEWLREHLTYPQSPNTYLYIVAREQLQRVAPGQPIVAQPVTVEGEFAHFLTDYEETPDGQICLHPAMTYASDPAEFISIVDESVYGDYPKLNRELRRMAGMWSAPTDVNSPAVVVVDPTGKKSPQKYELDILDALKFTLFLGLYAYQDDQPTGHLEDIYWASGAAGPTLFNQEIYDLYQRYKYRRLSIEEIREHLRQPTPMFVLRVHIDRERLLQAIASGRPPNAPLLEVSDVYEMPAGYVANSPQFVPRYGEKGTKEGYIVCDVVYSNRILSYRGKHHPPQNSWSENTEIWIFDAQNLAQGPLYKLSHARLNLGLTLHTTWMKEIAPVPVRDYSIVEDFEDQVNEAAKANPKIADEIKALFKQVYDRFNAAR